MEEVEEEDQEAEYAAGGPYAGGPPGAAKATPTQPHRRTRLLTMVLVGLQEWRSLARWVGKDRE